jgi:hypothetical protein
MGVPAQDHERRETARRLAGAESTLTLAAIVAISTAVRLWLSAGMPSPWVLPDELVYSDLSRSIAEGARPAVRGVPVFGWGEVYPTVIAPVWALVSDRHVAYHVALAVNAFVMSLAAVPAYFLGRLFVSRRSSLLVAAFAVAVPSLSYTGALLTENACYPVFLVAVLALARAVRMPTRGAQAVALAALGLLVFTRIQGIAMLGAYAAAIALYSLTAPAGERLSYLRRFVPTGVVMLLLASAPVVGSFARGDGPFGWLGQRSGTFDDFHPWEVPQWFVFLAVGLVLYAAVVPVVATLITSGMGLSRGADEPLRLFAAVALPTFVAMLLSVALVSASFDVDQIGNLNERYVFYVVPLMFVGMALWIERGLPRPRPWSRIAIVAACVAPVLLPIQRLDYNAGLQALALVPWDAIAPSAGATALVVGLATLCFGLVWATCTRGTTWRLWTLVALWMAFLGLFTVESNRVSASRTAAAFDGRAATWVDDALPRNANVAVLWDETQARKNLPDSFYFWLMVTEFYNDSIGDVYRLGPPTFYEDFLPTVPARVASGGSIVGRESRPVTTDYALVTCRTPITGDVVARAPHDALLLVRVTGALRLSGAAPCRREQP